GCLGRAAAQARVVAPVLRILRLDVLALGHEPSLAREDTGVDPVGITCAVGREFQIALPQILGERRAGRRVAGCRHVARSRHRTTPILTATTARGYREHHGCTT